MTSSTVTTDGTAFELAGRTGVFGSVTDFAYVPCASGALISSASGGRFALPSARTEQGGHSARYGRKEDVPVELRGAGVCSRQVNNYCLPGTFDAEQLLVCEVLTPGGNWSSYPPHKHDEARPGDTVPVPHGRHGPSIAAPGYDLYHLYHLNVMAGPGQDRARLICDDPAHGWVRSTWDAQDIDDRLPFEGLGER